MLTLITKTTKGIFQKPSALAIAVQELEEAKRQELVYVSAAEYHAKLAEFYKAKIDRLNTYISSEAITEKGKAKKWEIVPS